MNVETAATSSAEEKANSFGREALPHLDVVYRVALRFSGDASEAEDLAQQTMMKAYQAWDQYRLGTNVRAWLLTILRNETYMAHRRRKRARNTLEAREIDGVTVFERGHDSDPESHFFYEFVDDAVVRAVDSLPVEFREVAVLRYVESLSYNEIAEITGVRIGTIKSRLFRARKLLRSELRDYALEMNYVQAGVGDPSCD